MAINFYAFTEDENISQQFFAWVLRKAEEPMTELCAARGGTVRQREAQLQDELTGEPLGKLVYTLGEDDKVLDVDLLLQNQNTAELELLQEFGPFQEWNKNYIAAVSGSGQQFVAEAANRFVPGEDIEGGKVQASVSAFPWSIDIFASLKALNGAMGFGYSEQAEDIIPSAGGFAGGFSRRFTMPCVESVESFYSTIVGIVTGMRDVRLAAGDLMLDFIIVDLATGLGPLPIAVSRNAFDLNGLKEGAWVIMNASVKAELAEQA